MMKKNDLSTYPSEKCYPSESVCRPIQPNSFNPSVFFVALFDATNIQRKKYGLRTFRLSNILKNAANLHCNEMKKHKFFAHENAYNPNLKNVSNRVNAVGGNGMFHLIGENIADYPFSPTVSKKEISFWGLKVFSFSSPYKLESYKSLSLKIVDAWMNSPGHRANILNKNFIFVGFGAAIHTKIQQGISHKYILCAQNFGR